MEGNSYHNAGIWIQNLDVNYHAASGGVYSVPGVNGPNSQNLADYDPIDDEIVYYNNGKIYRYTRTTHTPIDTVDITGLPVPLAYININAIAYTGIPDMEVGIYNFVDKIFYYISKTTGVVKGYCPLPVSAPFVNSYYMGFANNLLWLYDLDSSQWKGYSVVANDLCSTDEATDTISATDSYEWINGVTYTESISGPQHTLSNIDGCDSIVTLDLTIINYCSSRSTRNRFEWVKQVELDEDIDNLSNKDGNGYGDYFDQVLVVDTGDIVSVTLTPGYRRRVYKEYWRIWADWNFDGDFNDAGEKVFEQNGKNIQSGTFTVPVNVDPNDLRLRVSMRWKRYAPSCGNYRNGEVEDYTIRVNGAQGYNNPVEVRLINEDNVTEDDLYEFIDIYPNPVQQGNYISGYIRSENTGIKQ